MCALGNSKIVYKHRQVGVAILVATGLAAAVCLLLASVSNTPSGRLISLSVAGALAVCSVIFSLLTVELSQDYLSWHFGPGVLHKKVPMAEMADVTVTRTRFIHGWGVHLTGDGWLYNVSGFGAVKITLRSGKTFLLGSDEPEALCAVIRRAIK